MKILWAITGAGYLLEEVVNFMGRTKEKHEVTAIFSNAGLEVAKMYGFFVKIKKISREIILEKEQGASFPFIGKITSKEYSFLLVAPCTANTIAKIAGGIADSLVTNLVAQAGKNKLPVIILPTDFQKKVVTKTPAGERITIHIREVDIKNLKKVKQMKGVKVVRKLGEINFKIKK